MAFLSQSVVKIVMSRQRPVYSNILTSRLYPLGAHSHTIVENSVDSPFFSAKTRPAKQQLSKRRRHLAERLPGVSAQLKNESISCIQEKSFSPNFSCSMVVAAVFFLRQRFPMLHRLSPTVLSLKSLHILASATLPHEDSSSNAQTMPMNDFMTFVDLNMSLYGKVFISRRKKVIAFQKG